MPTKQDLAQHILIALRDKGGRLESVNQKHGPFAGVFSFRFVKCTEATLGFTKFSGHTCMIEADSVPSKTTTAFYQATWDELDRLNIPYTFHWGKVLSLDAAKVRRCTAMRPWTVGLRGLDAVPEVVV